MKLYNRILWFILIAFISNNLVGQELVLPLEGNAVVKRHASFNPSKKAAEEVLLEIPFLDDFSNSSPFPDSSLWSDRFAYVNNSYPVNPVSYGVATLDGVDENGSIYSIASIYPKTFIADYLTSHPVNLNYPPADSLYLSFFYQPVGLGLQPDEYDSLCLDFYNPTLDTWRNIWQIPGDTLQPFQQVMIPIADTAFLKQGFRFRFRNRASLPHNTDYSDKRGNVDHWNIDYVRLDRLRSMNDTILRDVAFTKSLPSMLKDYQSVPWDHFAIAYNTHYLPYIEIDYFNNDTATRNVTRNLRITDLEYGDTYSSPSPTTQDIFPGAATTYRVSSIYPFEFNRGDTANFEIESYLRTDDFDNKANDTITRTQIFRDYFALDDGTAERAYGLRGQGSSGGLFAVRFESFIADEVGGLDIYFTQLYDSLNLGYYFKFMMWDDAEGVPGNIIYDGNTDYRVFYSDAINKYTRVKFENPVPVNGTFYIGILQYNQYLLNVGMDINHSQTGRLFYNLGSSWQSSSAPGSLMIRPYVKRAFSSVMKNTYKADPITLYPNPASDNLYFKRSGSPGDEITVKLYTVAGKLMISETCHDDHIYVGHLPEGIYIATFHSDFYSFPSEKIIISR